MADESFGSDSILGEDILSGDAAADAAFDSLPGGRGGWLHQIVLFAAK